MINIFFLINRQGKIRLTKFFDSFNLSERNKLLREIAVAVISRSSRLSNFYDYQNYKVIYKRYASLYFICLCDLNDNELTVLEFIHHYVECLDKYFGNVCELDIIFNFNKAYYILEEILIAGHVQESSKYI
jgi:AP-1 complex subunit sigma 1/2